MAIREINSSLNIMNTRLSVSESGSGESYLALHDSPGSKQDLAELIKFIPEGKGKLVNLNRPGHDSSEEILNPDKDPYIDTKLYAEVIDKKCDGSTWLLGYSFGAYTAFKIASQFPNKVKGLYLISPYINPVNESISTVPNWIKNPIVSTFLGIVKPLTETDKITKRIKNIFYPTEVSQAYLEKWLPRFTRFESLLANYNDINDMLNTYNEVYEKLSNIKMTVKVLFGRKDNFMDIENQSRHIKQCFPEAKISVEEELGHSLPLTNPEKCAEFLGWK